MMCLTSTTVLKNILHRQNIRVVEEIFGVQGEGATGGLPQEQAELVLSSLLE